MLRRIPETETPSSGFLYRKLPNSTPTRYHGFESTQPPLPPVHMIDQERPVCTTA